MVIKEIFNYFLFKCFNGEKKRLNLLPQRPTGYNAHFICLIHVHGYRTDNSHNYRNNYGIYICCSGGARIRRTNDTFSKKYKFSVYNMSQIQTFPTNFFKIAKTSLYSLLLGFRKNRLHALTTTKLLYMLMLHIYMYM